MTYRFLGTFALPPLPRPDAVLEGGIRILFCERTYYRPPGFVMSRNSFIAVEESFHLPPSTLENPSSTTKEHIPSVLSPPVLAKSQGLGSSSKSLNRCHRELHPRHVPRSPHRHNDCFHPRHVLTHYSPDHEVVSQAASTEEDSPTKTARVCFVPPLRQARRNHHHFPNDESTEMLRVVLDTPSSSPDYHPGELHDVLFALRLESR